MAPTSWVVLIVSSILLPFQLSPEFYRLGYALPAHEVFQTLLDICSGGCNPRLHTLLPVLFSWETLSFLGSVVGLYQRYHYDVVAEEQQEASFQDRLHATITFERERDEEGKETQSKPSQDDVAEELLKERQLGEAIRADNVKLGEIQSFAIKPDSFLFALHYGSCGRSQVPAEIQRQKTAP
ncbi:MAG: hypothetical protein MMC23_009036 [Stictis urceolatum]|nr:hypothetical protein [Stictis urceolata]